MRETESQAESGTQTPLRVLSEGRGDGRWPVLLSCLVVLAVTAALWALIVVAVLYLDGRL